MHPTLRWESLADRQDRCPRCLHWWVSHGVPGEEVYGCGRARSSLADRSGGYVPVCGCDYAVGNPVTARWFRALRQ